MSLQVLTNMQTSKPQLPDLAVLNNPLLNVFICYREVVTLE